MAGGPIPVSSAGKHAAVNNGQLTVHVIVTTLAAASGGLLFGYDLGVTGGVTSMDDFLEKFFPKVYRQRQRESESAYCKFDSQTLQLFTSSLFLAGLVSGIVASKVTRSFGRKLTMLVSGIFFLAGAAISAGAVNLAMLIVGRILLGVGVGFANQAVPLYLSEMAPAHLRGALAIMFQLATTLGILSAQLINYGTQYIHPWGWRLSLGLAAVPASMLTLAGLILPETPNSLIQRGHLEHGRKVLRKVRGVEDVEAEFNDIYAASQQAARIRHPFRNILRRKYRPQLTFAILIPAFQQLTGINAIMFYAPVIFSSLGSGRSSALLSAVIIGAVNAVATLVSSFTVDRVGRRLLFLEGGVQMLVSQVAMAITLGIIFSGNKSGNLGSAQAAGVLVIVCVYVAAFAWSWGPLGWLVPSEIQPLETRSAGQGITVAVNFLFSFVIGQAFLSMLCSMEYGIFLFFAGFVLIMTLFIYFFLPETKGVPIEDVTTLWQEHRIWKRVVPQAELPKVKEAVSTY